VAALPLLAAEGRLASTVAGLPAGCRRAAHAGAFLIADPVVYLRQTRRLERDRGHYDCATSIARMRTGCRDQHTDAVLATIDHVFRATARIKNLTAFIAGCTRNAVVDAHRRFRGSRGALQRDRVPCWLSTRLGDDPWLCELARLVIEFVGTDVTPGYDLWPVHGWALRRASYRGDGPEQADLGATIRELDQVLRTMRSRRPKWFAEKIEGPLGRKEAAVAPPLESDGQEITRPALRTVDVSAHDDARQRELAAVALTGIVQRIRAGEEAAQVVREVVTTVFTTGPDLAVDEVPHCAASIGERASALVRDPAELERIVQRVLTVVRSL
jgi:hypothetical protein